MRYLYTLALSLLIPLASLADGPIAPDGKTQVQIDLPLSLRMFNKGGSDGAGLCVFTSINHAAFYQGEYRLYDLQAKMTKLPGGGWPEKVDRLLARFAPSAQYIQVTNCDLDFLKMVLKEGYLPSVTWGGNHMLNLVHLDENWACILDNNSAYGTGPNGERVDNKLQWMKPAEFKRRASIGGGIWCVVLLEKGPPSPMPVNWLAAADDWRELLLPPRYEWRFFSARPGDLYLYEDGILIGGTNPKGEYRPYYARYAYPHCWGKPCPCPVEIPAVPESAGKGTTIVKSIPDYGMRVTWGGKVRYTLNGKEITAADAWAAIQDRVKCRRVTVVGSEEARKRILADLSESPTLAQWKGQLLVQDYEPESPLARDVGFRPGVYIQSPAGRVLHFQGDYSDGPQGLATALRRTDPNYDPSRDPDLRRSPAVDPVSVSAVDLTSLAPLGLVALAAGAFGFLPTRKVKTQWPLG